MFVFHWLISGHWVQVGHHHGEGAPSIVTTIDIHITGVFFCVHGRVGIEPVLVQLRIVKDAFLGSCVAVSQPLRTRPKALEDVLRLPVVGVRRHDVFNFNGLTQLLVHGLFKVNLLCCAAWGVSHEVCRVLLVMVLFILAADILADNGGTGASRLRQVPPRLCLIVTA